LVSGNLDKQGSFAEFLVVEESFSAKIPEHMSFEDGTTIGVAISTAAISLYGHLGLPRCREAEKPFKEYVMIYGASSAMGTMMVQVSCLAVSACGESPITIRRVRHLLILYLLIMLGC
jgi:NADPH:quinone reductase-like Zn-dependent oxidoreductase